MVMKLTNLPLIQALRCLDLSLFPEHSRSERKWQWYCEMRFCSVDRFKALLATDEPPEWSKGQRSRHTDLSVSRSRKARYQKHCWTQERGWLGFLPYRSSCSLSSFNSSFHVPAPMCGCLRSSKMNSVYWFSNYPSREQKRHTVTWEGTEDEWVNCCPHLSQRRQGNSNCFKKSHVTQPNVKGSSLFPGPAPKGLNFQARENQAVRSSITRGDVDLFLAIQNWNLRRCIKSSQIYLLYVLCL